VSGVAISVVVPTRDRAAVLGSSLASIAAQRTSDPFEVIVVANASTDATPEVVRDWCRRDERFRALREERLGRSPAMNAGIAVARGPLLAFTDDDIELGPGWLEAFRAFFAEHTGSLVVAGGAIEAAPPDLSTWPAWLSEASLADGPGLDHGTVQRRLASHEFIWGASMAAPADVFRRLGTWDESVGRRGDHRGTYEDTEFQRRIREAGGEVWYLPAARLRHRVARAEVTPRRVLDRAFRTGRNLAWFPAAGAPAAPSGAGRAAARFGSWLVAVAAFRMRPSPDRFDEARLAARAAGEVGERAASRHGAVRARAQRLAWLAARAILRLAPDRA
jgi:glycosyltransferase involved in cell wall biosynthesis